MNNKTGPRGGCTFAFIRIIAVLVFVASALTAGKMLITPAPAMAPTQFGEFSEGYLKRKAQRAEKRKMRPTPEIQCWDFDKNDTPKGFAHALENPVPCKDLVR
jgi:hypothetical protein